MGGIPVLFNDNHYQVVSRNELDQLLTTGRIKAFRRAGGWAMIGQDPLRGKGGTYRGPERRKQIKRPCSHGAIDSMQKRITRKKRSCLTCSNLVGGRCRSTLSATVKR